MTPGVVEEGAKVTTSLIEGLKSQPLSLALVALNIIFLLFVGWLAHEFNQRTNHQYEVKDQLIAQLIEKCRSPQSTPQ